MQETKTDTDVLNLNGLASTSPVLLLKLNQGNTLDLLKRCAHAGVGSPTITFQKDHAIVSIPSKDGIAQETHFRIAKETLPNLLLHHTSSGWSGAGYVTSKLHPKEWSKTTAASSIVDDSTKILSMSQEVQQLKKTSASAKAAKRSASELTGRPVPQKVPSKATAKAAGKISASARRLVESDSGSSGSDDDSESSEDENHLAAISRRRGKRPTTSPHEDAPIPLKKPRATPIPVPQPSVEKEFDANGADGHASSHRHSAASSTVHTPHSATTSPTTSATGGKKPRSTSPVEQTTSKLINSIGTTLMPHLHTIESIEIATDLFPETKDIQNFDDFERCYLRYKELWPRYIRLHGELMKNKADFETLKHTMEQMEAKGENTTKIAEELRTLYDLRQPIVDPMRITYTKLHTAMQMARMQLESYSTKHLP